ncbi:MAG: anthranilate synthase component I family protein [Nitriliruptoraceae bacterium]
MTGGADVRFDALPAAEPLVHTDVEAPRDQDGLVDLDGVVDALGGADLLESADASGWSYVVPHGRWRLRDDGHRTRLHGPGGLAHDLGPDPFEALERLCAHLGAVPGARADPSLPPLTGGLLGVLAYELGSRIERLPTPTNDDRGRDQLAMRIVEVVCAVPPTREHVLLLARPLPPSLAGPDGAETSAGACIEDARRRLGAAARRRVRADTARSTVPRPPAQVAWTSLPRADHLRLIRRVLDAIAAGEVFQVNLTQRLSARWPGDVHTLYRSLREASPAAYGAALPDAGVASISPETFLRVEGRAVTTRPIKGTRPRARDAALDAALADDLATAGKDRAENVMVVDLERNDLGRVCRTGSIQVPELTRLQGLPTVWHLVSTVRGTLADDVGYGRLLRATFPSGSITGAPKIAAMTLIGTLEPVRRGAYCGAIGFLSPGQARLSVAIRTAVLHGNGEVDHGAGGGIVADSDPVAEHAESLDKAAAFLRAVRARRVVPAPSRTTTAPPAPSVRR